ncbi:MAG: DHH family phosphoesterase [Gammaproteobacteria bacterium]
MNFDVFNGDADGICALLQLRLAEPRESILITGVKRDISLLQRVNANPGDRLTVLDVSLDKNRQPLLELLEKQVEVFYADHHQAGDIPEHPHLKALIDTDANVCTSLLVDRYLNHRFSAWAVVAAFGDNLEQSALHAARPLTLSDDKLQQFRDLGVCINYNAYGESIEDLHFAPDALFQLLSGYESPLDFISDRPDVFRALTAGYAADMESAFSVAPEYQTDKVAVFILPNEKWARRVSGVWSNELANRNPERAHAVLTVNKQGGYLISVRAPLSNRSGADVLCGQFPSGGGRKAAAGINHLPKEQLPVFVNEFEKSYRG